jgi:hypothetical protein
MAQPESVAVNALFTAISRFLGQSGSAAALFFKSASLLSL